MMREIGHFIGGKEVKGSSGRFGDVFNPNTGEVQAKVALADKSDVDKAIANAEAAFPVWAATNPQRRARVMFKFLELIQREFDDSRACSPPSTAKRSPIRGATSSAVWKSWSSPAAFRIC
jgi:malonate-semialdehyde dehydrogenase (acetylating)/methylmalonate-semialdehyde dehydrogenase